MTGAFRKPRLEGVRENAQLARMVSRGRVHLDQGSMSCG